MREGPMMERRATIADVAERAGVSRAAVSKVLRDAYGVSPAMREKVSAAMQALAYRPQMAARGLRGSTDTLGIILPDISNPFFSSVLDGIARRLASTRLQTLLGVRPAEIETERSVVETMLDRNLDGLIMIAPRLDRAFLARVARQVPLVIIGDHTKGEGFDTVNGDDALGAEIVVDHLAALGHRRIAHLGLGVETRRTANPVTVRRHGYEAAMRRRGLTQEIRIVDIGGGHPGQDDLQALDSLLRSETRPTAIFAWRDAMALTVMASAVGVGLRLPDGLSLVGYDDSPIAAHPLISLSSVNQSGAELGERAAEALLERRDGRADERHDLVEPKLIVRTSSAGRPRASA